MRKHPASTSLEPEIYARLERLAKVERRSVAELIARCVEKHIPQLEAAAQRKPTLDQLLGSMSEAQRREMLAALQHSTKYPVTTIDALELNERKAKS